ncbi:FUSC family protein [Pseudomonas lopnurensis]|uniref:FUSC family protein n=1 Tax=Pseudomonas lopnurensis TaxID=1477517 RepID=UPI0018797E22|nr:FUSC family protein [Pseudomonas lopnurensis]MBE7373550.1 FUSC family protein [Pseudomonas lopnurensis]
MKRLLRQSLFWHPGHPAWGAAMVAGFGCALPLLLGLFSGHPGFLWATVGAFQAAKANPLHRFGMLRMLLLIALGACSTGLGFWSATHPLISLGLFAFYGLLLAWLQRYGSEAGKLGIGLAICLCLGQGQYGIADFNNPYAIAMLFALGGLWVTLLAFGMRGMHGLRMWPYMPRLLSILRVLRRHARRTPIRQWRVHAVTYMLAAALGGIIVNLAELPRGYWLTLAVFTTLQMDLEKSLVRALQAGIGIFIAAAILIYLGHGLADPPLMVMILLPLVVLGRAFQANHYGLFVLQTTLLFLLLAETLAQDWNLPQIRLLNAAIGVSLALLITSLMHLLRVLLARRSRSKAQPIPTQRADDQTTSRP